MSEAVAKPAPAQADDRELSVEYELEPRDLTAFAEWYWDHFLDAAETKKKARILLGMIVLLSLAVGLIGFEPGKSSVWGLFILPSGVIGLWWLMFAFAWRQRREKIQVIFNESKHLAAGASWRLVIGTGGIRQGCDGEPAFIRWEEIDKVVGTPGYIFVCLSPVNAMPVPRRAFADEAAFRSFMLTAQKYHWPKSPRKCVKCGYDLYGNASGRCPECGLVIEGFPKGSE